MKGQKLGTVKSFKYLGAVVSDDGSKPEILSRVARAVAAFSGLEPVWGDRRVPLASRVSADVLPCCFSCVCLWVVDLGGGDVRVQARGRGGERAGL